MTAAWDPSLVRWSHDHRWSHEVVARVAEFGVESLADLGEAFTCEAELPAVAGLAAAWREVHEFVRGNEPLRVRDLLVASAQRVALEATVAPVRLALPRRVPGLRWRPPMRVHRSTSRAVPVVDAVGEDELLRLTAAREAVTLASGWKHAGGFGARLKESPTHLREIVFQEKLVAISKFEPKVIKAALRVWSSLCHWAKTSPEATPELPAAVVSAYIEHVRPRGSTVAKSTFEKLSWVVKHLDAPPSLLPAVRPPARQDAAEETPVDPAEPEVVLWLEGLLRKCMQKQLTLSRVQESTLLMSMVICYGVLRGCHVQRSGILGITGSSLWGICRMGKSRRGGARRSFRWRIPRYGLAGVDFGLRIFEDFEKMKASGGKPPAFLFTSGTVRGGSLTPLSMQTFNATLKKFMAQTDSPVAGGEGFSSYAFRRFLPTWADLRRLGTEDRQALGNWREAPAGKVKRDPEAAAYSSSMGLRYAGRKDDSAELVKIEAVTSLRMSIAALTSGSVVTWVSLRSVIPDAKEVEVRSAKIWQQAGELRLSTLGRMTDAAPKASQVVRQAAVQEDIDKVGELALLGAAPAPSSSGSSSSSASSSS